MTPHPEEHKFRFRAKCEAIRGTSGPPGYLWEDVDHPSRHGTERRRVQRLEGAVFYHAKFVTLDQRRSSVEPTRLVLAGVLTLPERERGGRYIPPPIRATEVVFNLLQWTLHNVYGQACRDQDELPVPALVLNLKENR